MRRAAHGFLTATTALDLMENQIFAITTFDESGLKIVKISEMRDSAVHTRFAGELRRHMAERAAAVPDVK